MQLKEFYIDDSNRIKIMNHKNHYQLQIKCDLTNYDLLFYFNSTVKNAVNKTLFNKYIKEVKWNSKMVY